MTHPSTCRAEVEALRAERKRHRAALKTLLCFYADDMVGEAAAAAARDEIRAAGGVLAFITDAMGGSVNNE